MKKVTSIVLALIMALSVIFCAVPALAADNQAAQNAAAANNHHSIGLTGVKNARELGGYKTTDGRTVKSGKLLRTGKLVKATDEDKQKLVDTYHLTKDIDFRFDAEIAKDPDPTLPGVEYYNFPAVGISMIDLTSEEGQGYTKDALNSLIKMDKDGNLIVLWHCSAGKDRAGNAAFLLLILLGVDQETAIQDFLNTNYFKQEEIQESYDKVYKLTKDKNIANDIASNEGVKREWIEESIKTIMSVYGSYDNYFHQGLGLSDADIQQLRAAYTE